MPDFDTTVHALRRWAAQMSASDRAAVELLAWHETWLRRPDFTAAAVQNRGVHLAIDWASAREFIDRGYAQPGQQALPASSSQQRVLNLAVALGEDTFGLAGMGHVHRWHMASAFASACGKTLEGPIPEPGHSHPDFIPGDPATCQACARSAADEGRDY